MHVETVRQIETFCAPHDKVMFFSTVVFWGQISSSEELNRVKSDNLTNIYAPITRKRCSTGYKLVLFTNRKSHRPTGFQSVPKSVTLNDLERPSGHTCSGVARHGALGHVPSLEFANARKLCRPNARWLSLLDDFVTTNFGTRAPPWSKILATPLHTCYFT